ncbi:aminotransferase class I/II-fold pyridoxal phosphate-dependent enzyme [Lysinibacillus sp. FSL M8-0216]|uniref:cysteine-S-conjugate beta-lyase n=1 Tax=Lysinibacillus fusiformis TaxID=28031 RepID=A0A1H9KCE5_9BACI|nr:MULTISPECIES: aminotransferase class I/II-fold pyridoxal phosphate-dependent enzyme [Lysinibacillus]MED4669993.1 aminotransferase class I/II-fold pyridoxal phosphate-dependent enzyme [Lysinibacillus fusiformis]QAS56427.1 aminotransferase class V-fold PLP-dependent enzyme [Lysinibacillus sphaericus]RDV31410.1 aminotransferase class V-fold PLP-dependent enzyme [Lysinibacillus fusiformis]SCY48762.1 cystathionine beta-lyase [Lysinibacillus fusiformis]SEN83284.1 cystathionine beta-lyase [Lysinib
MKQHIETSLIHAGVRDGYSNKKGAVNVPMYLSSTFHQESIDEFGEYDYARSGNPTRDALEKAIAELEGGVRAHAFSSGIAAVSAALMLLSQGDHIVMTEDVYGGTYRFVTKVLPRFGISHTFVDFTDLAAVEAAITPATKLLYMETPSNPTLGITDIRGVVELAKQHRCLTFLDNTFMTPLHQRPLELGVDVVIHSATKFLSGHSDIIAGLTVTADEKLGQDLYFIQNSFGNILGVQDSFTLLQNIKTTDVRFSRSTQSAQKIAEFLATHTLVEQVYYPGLSSHPGHDIHQRQSTSSGAVLSFRLPSYASAKALVEAMKIPVFAVSLGGVESILSYPAKMSHAAMEPEERAKRGITDGLLRFSVGLEHVDDLIDDFAQALEVAAKA